MNKISLKNLVSQEITRGPKFFMNSGKMPSIPDAFPFFKLFIDTSTSLGEKSQASSDLDSAFCFKVRSSSFALLLNGLSMGALEVSTIRFAITSGFIFDGLLLFLLEFGSSFLSSSQAFLLENLKSRLSTVINHLSLREEVSESNSFLAISLFGVLLKRLNSQVDSLSQHGMYSLRYPLGICFFAVAITKLVKRE